MLDTLAENRINIKDLSLETPQREHPTRLDAILDLSGEEWTDVFHSYLQEGSGLWDLYIAIQYAFPEATKNPDFKPDENMWSGGLQQAKFYQDSKNNSALARQAGRLKLLYPDKPELHTLDEQFWHELLQENHVRQFLFEVGRQANLNPQGRKEAIQEYAVFAYWLKILNPDKVSDLNLNNDIADAMEPYVLEARKENDYIGRWDAFYKVLFPDRFKPIGLSEAELHSAYNLLEKYRNMEDWDRFMNLAFNLKIITADEVRITDEGLQIIDSQPKMELREPVPEIPEVRRF